MTGMDDSKRDNFCWYVKHNITGIASHGPHGAVGDPSPHDHYLHGQEDYLHRVISLEETVQRLVREVERCGSS